MLKEIRQYCTFKNKTGNYKIQYNKQHEKDFFLILIRRHR